MGFCTHDYTGDIPITVLEDFVFLGSCLHPLALRPGRQWQAKKKKKKKKKGEINLEGKSKIRQPRYLKAALAQSPPRSAIEMGSSEKRHW